MVTTRTAARRVASIVTQTMTTRGVSVKQLAEDTGIARTTLARRLTGNSPFTLNELDTVADQLGLTAIEVLTAAERAA